MICKECGFIGLKASVAATLTFDLVEGWEVTITCYDCDTTHTVFVPWFMFKPDHLLRKDSYLWEQRHRSH